MQKIQQLGMGIVIAGVLLGMGIPTLAQVGANVDTDVTTTLIVDPMPSFHDRIGMDAKVKAQLATDHAMDVKENDLANETDAKIGGVDVTTATLLLKLGINPVQFEHTVSVDQRATILSHILSARAEAIARIEAHSEARAALAARLQSRVDILLLTGLEQAIARIEYAHVLALREGETDLAAKFEVVLARLRAIQAQQDDTDEVNETDAKEIDGLAWELHSRLLLKRSGVLITVAQRVDVSLQEMIAKMNAQSARLEDEGQKSYPTVDGMVERIKGYQSRLHASIEAAIVARAAFESENTVSNARILHSELVEMKSLAKHAGQAVNVYVRLHNFIKGHLNADPTVTNAIIVDVMRVDIDTEVQNDVKIVMDSSLYGEAQAST